MPHLYLAPGSSLTSRCGPLAHQTSVSLGQIVQHLLPRPCPQAHLSHPHPLSHSSEAFPAVPANFCSGDPRAGRSSAPEDKRNRLSCPTTPPTTTHSPYSPLAALILLPCRDRRGRYSTQTAHLVSGALTKCDLHWPHLRAVALTSPDQTGLRAMSCTAGVSERAGVPSRGLRTAQTVFCLGTDSRMLQVSWGTGCTVTSDGPACMTEGLVSWAPQQPEVPEGT